MPEQNQSKTVWKGRHLSIAVRGKWEWATRNIKKSAVGIIAVTDDHCVVLVEQFRPPIGRSIVELPAGLAGDIPGTERETLVEAAKRELLEETGYTASQWTELLHGYTSPGLTDESVVLFLALGLKKSGPGGGDADESIKIHEVPIPKVLDWLAHQNSPADLKLLAGLWAARQLLERRPNCTF
ncbi:MAG: NUDIX hydrolase [Pirellulales bacterium]|nr:NUDIX hydrolase [Pirellulales bacterium]